MKRHYGGLGGSREMKRLLRDASIADRLSAYGRSGHHRSSAVSASPSAVFLAIFILFGSFLVAAGAYASEAGMALVGLLVLVASVALPVLLRTRTQSLDYQSDTIEMTLGSPDRPAPPAVQLTISRRVIDSYPTKEGIFVHLQGRTIAHITCRREDDALRVMVEVDLSGNVVDLVEQEDRAFRLRARRGPGDFSMRIASDGHRFEFTYKPADPAAA